MGEPHPRAPYTTRRAERQALLDGAVVRLCAFARELGDVEAVYVFGSYAREAVRPTSDLDILIVRKTAERPLDRDLPFRLALDVPVGLDIIVVTPDEYRNELPRTSFGQSILATARRVDAA